MSDKDKPYEVGYKKTPKKNQFVKGQSGNPGGRPPGSRKADDIIIHHLNRKVPMRINGKSIKATALDAIVMGQIKKAVDKTDTRAAKFLMDLLSGAEERKYYLETAIQYIHKRITMGIQKQISNPKEAQKMFDQARIIAEAAVQRSEDEEG